MSDPNKKNSELIEVYGQLQKLPANYGLMKINRWLLAIVCSLMAVIVILGFSLLPAHGFVNDYKSVTASRVDNIEMNPVLSAEVNALKGQMAGLVSGSIESKMRSLEANIRTGSVANSLGTLEDLKNDFKVLRTYSEPAKKQNVVENEQLLKEVTQLRKLIHLTLASCGLMLAAVAGIWIKNSNLLPNKKVKTNFLGKN